MLCLLAWAPTACWGAPSAAKPAVPDKTSVAAKTCLEKGIALYKGGKLTEATTLLKAALLLTPGNVAPLYWLGRCYLGEKQYAEAEASFKTVLAKNPNSAETLYWIGQVCEARKQFQEALLWYGRALEADAKHKASATAMAGVKELMESSETPLLRKLKAKEEVVIAALGDSITFGIGVPDAQQNAFPALFARGLKERYANPNITLYNCGDPGSPAFFALSYLDSHVVSRQPDLVIIQLGGNDSRMNTPLPDFRAALAEIIAKIRQESKADIILAVPPMLESGRDMQIIQALKEEGQKSKLVVADFNTTLNRAEHDFRGLFPWEGHPNEYSHVLMAQELDRAFRDLVGSKEMVEVAIEETVETWLPGQKVMVHVDLQNRSAVQQQGACTLWVDDKSTEQAFVLLPMDRSTAMFTFELPQNPASGRTDTHRLWAAAKTSVDTVYDVKWIARAPTIPCSGSKGEPQAVEGPVEGNASLRRILLGETAIVSGRQEWEGEEDLSARCDVGCSGDNLRISIDVKDQKIIPGRNGRAWENDSVEIYFDLRTGANQAKPFFDKNVFILYVIPAAGPEETPTWNVLEGPPAALEGMKVESHPCEGGYGIDLKIPLESLKKVVGDLGGCIGFDVSVNDADFPGKRETQMTWAGTTDNYLNPRYFGALNFAPEANEKALRLSLH